MLGPTLRELARIPVKQVLAILVRLARTDITPAFSYIERRKDI